MNQSFSVALRGCGFANTFTANGIGRSGKGFYNEIESAMAENKFEETKDTLLEFISKNSDEIKGICFYLECLIELKQFEEVEMFIGSLEKDVQNKDEVKQVLKKMEIVKNNSSGPNIGELLDKLEN